jgi:competence ComEA-like helix-hairpin-helix protein
MSLLTRLRDSFGFTRNELRVLALLSAVITAGLGMRWYRTAYPGPPDLSPPFSYRTLDSVFFALSRSPDSTGTSDAGARTGARTPPPRRAPVDVNTAGIEELLTLPGIGPATARHILDDRAQRGPYQTVDDLLRVKGIGPKKLARLRAHVRVGTLP